MFLHIVKIVDFLWPTLQAFVGQRVHDALGLLEGVFRPGSVTWPECITR